MTSKYYIHSVPSTIAGVIAAGGSIALLTRDAMSTGFTMDHALMPVLVGLTVLFGHEAWRAAKEWKLISALAFFTLTVFGTGLITYETMGRRAEVRDAKTATETKGVDQYAKLMADLNTANQLEAEAESWVANECKTGLGPKCRGVTYTRDQRRAHAEKLRAAAEAHEAPAPVDAKASRVAAIFALFGYSVDATKAAVQTFEPFVLPLFLELGSIFLFGFGVRHRSVSSVSTVSSVSAPEKLTSFSVERELSDAEIEEIKRILGKQKKPVTNDELAALAGVSKAEMSKRVSKCVNAGIIEKLKAGKFAQISLVA
jgi:hypothetical protein